MNVCVMSSPKPTLVQSTIEQALKNLVHTVEDMVAELK